ncbi:protein RRP6-like 2 isoform X2 [Magnolia sinica]|uniref:protein RRP6-like 2 isoform X2 n=1 Tax=Magnolia sinica TaxID=86752 RepID=UPI00265AE7D4|nr:protein RRP6-like 2 isoform X2 [Magnolia sinica]
MERTSGPDPPSSKAETLQSLASGSLSSSISSLSASSRPIPSDKDFHFFYNFDDFKLPIKAIAENSESLLKSISFGRGPPSIFPSGADPDDAYDWLVNLNDEIFERVDISLDEFQRARKKEEGLGMTADGFQLVYGKKKKKVGTRNLEGNERRDSTAASTVRMASKDANRTGERPRVPFHIPTIPRPQDQFGILVNNSNQPFDHVWLQRSEEDGRLVHPLEKLSEADFVDRSIGDVEPVKPLPLDSTPFNLVEGVNELKGLAAKLRHANEFAVDLEHNQYRSFQGLTCLMQISTRTEDFVVDTLKLRIHIGPHLREAFKDPSKRKVMHGADRDILWLQRDFGIYVCNLFDTGQASRVLQLERNSLEYLLHHFCGVTANKEYQNADWRLRPIPDEMIKYAREDTHYLLHIYDLMRGRLLSASTESESGGDLLLEVYKRSYDICMQLYEKELLTSTSYLHIYGLQGADFNSRQLAIVAGLSEWRDIIAREEDESTGYILPNKALLEIARQMPTTSGKLHRMVRSKHPYVERNLGPVVGIIRSAITNAAAFENALEQLKKGRAETVREQIMEAAAADAENRRAECMEVSANVKEESSEQASMNFYRGECQPSISSSETVCSVELSQEARIESSHLAKAAAVASVQILKKPNRAFGAMLGHSASKRKLDGDPKGSFLEKEKAEVKVEQIKSSVTLPFHSFSGKSKQPVSTADRSIKPCDLLHRETNECVHEPAEVAELEDIIPLETGSNDRESSPEIPDGPENGTTRGSPSGSDTADEPTSLTDLASSFQNFFQSGNQKRNSKQERTQEADSFLLKPFDYAAARKQKRFGDSQEQKVDVEGGNDVLRAPLDSMESHKGLISGRARREETSREFPQPRRRQAFPASGNRSATFR